MLHRTQIQITDEQDRALRRLARREGISLAEAIRRCIDRTLEAGDPSGTARYDALASLAGAFEDDDADAARQHDRHLDEGYEWPTRSS